MHRVGRISTSGAGKGAEHATHEGHNAGKADRFREAVAQAAGRSRDGESRDAASGDGGSGQHEAEAPPPEGGFVVIR